MKYCLILFFSDVFFKFPAKYFFQKNNHLIITERTLQCMFRKENSWNQKSSKSYTSQLIFFSLGVNILIDCHQWIHRCSFDWFKQKTIICLARITRLKADLCVIKYSKYLQVINSRWFFRWASTSSEANGQTSARLFALLNTHW